MGTASVATSSLDGGRDSALPTATECLLYTKHCAMNCICTIPLICHKNPLGEELLPPDEDTKAPRSYSDLPKVTPPVSRVRLNIPTVLPQQCYSCPQLVHNKITVKSEIIQFSDDYSLRE